MERFSDEKLKEVVKNVNEDNKLFIEGEKIENEQNKNKPFMIYIDKDDKKQVLNNLNEEVMKISKKISTIKRNIISLNEEKIKNDRKVKNYLALTVEYKHLVKIVSLLILLIGIPLITMSGFLPTLGILNKIIITIVSLGLLEAVGLTAAKLVFENAKKKYKIKYFNNKDITLEEMKKTVDEKSKELDEKINELEIKRAGIIVIKNNKKEEIKKIESLNNSDIKMDQERKIKYEDSEKKEEYVKVKRK